MTFDLKVLGLLVVITFMPFKEALFATEKKSQTNEERPNIIFLLTDDQRWDCFGFNNPDVKTPHCDKMANEGIVFENAFHAVPICQPSRASIQLGRYMDSHRCSFSKPTDYSISAKEYDQSYPAMLRNAGYFTGFVGKFGFPVSEQKEHNVDYDQDGMHLYLTQRWKKDEFMPKKYFDVWDGHEGQGKYDMHGEKGHLTKVNGDKAIDFIKTAKSTGKPFCLSVSFKAPHSPFNVVDPKFSELYKDVSIDRRANDSKEFNALLPEVVKNEYRGRNGIADGKYQSFIKAYYGLISGVDDVVGRIRVSLKEQGLDDNTIIIYTSDNGYFCGSKGLSGKDLLYEESLRAPIIIYNPKLNKRQRNKKVDELISVIDFAPTILDLCHVDKPPLIQGKSFKSIIDGKNKEINQFIFAENNFDSFKHSSENGELNDREVEELKLKGTVRSKVVRSLNYKYIRYHETEPMVEELWDIKNDPLETKNRAGDPFYFEVLQEMRLNCDSIINENKEQAKLVLLNK